ncbi:acidic phospholipase A2 1-like [Limanda limanda]|uniref:acidic phospholipase A2 1-like n=1 Tax=Limanda limanda TaxID=27771 RepID=UPI0029C8C09F|nr:acidic phospholipase A2 1-like [Limanda limanda]
MQVLSGAPLHQVLRLQVLPSKRDSHLSRIDVENSGTPVDELDRCCQVHDNCYGDALEHHPCRTIFHSPLKLYSYNCDEASKTVTCDEDNNACGMFICECDRTAAECFARSPYNNDHYNLPSDRCQ